MATESFGAVDSASSLPLRAALLTFLIADVRGYTRFTVEQGDEAAARLASRFADLTERVVADHEGEVLELRGDEALAVFPSARTALRCSLALQQAFTRSVEADPALPLMVGIGLDAGEALPVKGGYRGGALNLAARLCSIAGPGEVFASEGMVQLASKTEGIAFLDRGEVTLKGFGSPVRVIQIAPEGVLPEEMPPLQPTLVTHPNNLPDELTPLIGREREIDQVVGLLRYPHIRMVTLAGPGGTGKTRLALQVGNTLLHEFRDGVFFVNLAPLADPVLVSSAIAGVLGIKEVAGKDLLETLVASLKDRHLLLVVDNFEHLLAASSVVGSLLDGCRELHVLVTSRVPLHLSRENEYPVSPLTVPDLLHLPAPETLSRYEAVALFIQRARAVKPDFAVTNENASAVAEICFRLDGLPLAVELAAARIKLLPPQALLQRLSRGLGLLTGGARDAPARQQTLRNTIDWSYSLLAEEEQTLFVRLSVFAGGCTFEAAEAVCNPEGDIDVLEGMASLLDKSLLRQEGEGEPRLTMLKTLREYAAEELAQQGERDLLQQRHAQYFIDLVEEAEPKLNGSEQTIWLGRLEREHDNLRAALAWCLEQREGAQGEKAAQAAETGLSLAGSLHWFWLYHDHHREGLMWLEQVLARAAPRRTGVWAKALINAGVLAGLAGNLAESKAFLSQGIALSREVGDQKQLSIALAVLGSTPWGSEWDVQAAAALEESLTLARGVGDPWLIGHALLHSVFRAVNGPGIERAEERARAWAAGTEGLSCFQVAGDRVPAAVMELSLGQIALRDGDYTRARTAFLACLPVLRTMGWRSTVADGLVGLADVACEQGDVEEAAALYAEGLALYRQIGDHLAPAVAWVHRRLARMYLEQGDWTAARTHATESLTIARATGQVEASEIVAALEVQAALLAQEASPGSLRLAGAVAALRSYPGFSQVASDQSTSERRLTYLPQSPRSPREPSDQTRSDHWPALARHALSEDEQATAWAEGQAMSLEEAIAFALTETG